jgi:CO/xanthine dehydrogenase FAD-binding subunit
VQAVIPALAALAGGIGDPHVRNMGTIGATQRLPMHRYWPANRE